MPKSPFILDTFDMTLYLEGKKIPLDPNNIGDIETAVWYNKIIPYTLDSRKDLRFCDRRDLSLD